MVGYSLLGGDPFSDEKMSLRRLHVLTESDDIDFVVSVMDKGVRENVERGESLLSPQISKSLLHFFVSLSQSQHYRSLREKISIGLFGVSVITSLLSLSLILPRRTVILVDSVCTWPSDLSPTESVSPLSPRCGHTRPGHS